MILLDYFSQEDVCLGGINNKEYLLSVYQLTVLLEPYHSHASRQLSQGYQTHQRNL